MKSYYWVIMVVLLSVIGIYFFTLESSRPSLNGSPLQANVLQDESSFKNNSLASEGQSENSNLEASLNTETKNVAEINNEVNLENDAKNLETENKAEDNSLKQIQFSNDDFVLGEESAPIVIAVFSDFQCPFCRDFSEQVLPQIKSNYIDSGKVKLAFKFLPLPIHNKATVAAITAACSGRQDKFWEMHDLLFENLEEWAGSEEHQEVFYNYARKLKLNMVNFKKCYENQEVREQIENDVKTAQNWNLSSTPAFVINGYVVSGAYPYAIFEKIFETLLGEIK